jgi:CubicO group peptidase (beta-lactamase class C family)
MSANRKSATLAELMNAPRLAQALASAFDDVATRRAFVGLRLGHEVAYASVEDEGVVGGGDVPCEPMPVGCLAKILTATLAWKVLAKARIDVDTLLGSLVDLGASSTALGRITLRHLLDHTHGLDDSLIVSPTLLDGFIDVIDLARRASTVRPLAQPGALYSYGGVGAWLVAATLERLAARPYAKLLFDELLAPLGICLDSSRAATGRPCPANGGALALTIADWIRVLGVAAANPALRDATDDVPSSVAPLPGWNPLERGVLVGWKYHGRGWFGHQSVWPGSSGLVRVNPRRRIEIALLSRDHAASVIAARIFGEALPELFEFRVPLSLASGAVPTLLACVGCYASGRWHVEIRQSETELDLCVEDNHVGTRQCALLSPAAARTFFVRGPAIESFPYVQLVGESDSEVTHLWNGRFVLRRL